MKSIKADNLTCPLDGERLSTHERTMTCPNGHVFDIAKQGYVNLLPVQHKRSKQPGDSKEMVLARSGLLNSGVYTPIARKLADIVSVQLAEENREDACLMDSGCGEGYYLDYLSRQLEYLHPEAGDSPNEHKSVSFIGLDISKHAITAAAKRNAQICWVVGTNRQPPVEEASVDIIICMFGFHSFDGFYKALKPDGKVILVEPGPGHLQELREIIYPDIKKQNASSLDESADRFSLIDSQPLQFQIRLDNKAQINNLLVMTPHLYRASKEGKEAASRLLQLDLTVDVLFHSLQKI